MTIAIRQAALLLTLAALSFEGAPAQTSQSSAVRPLAEIARRDRGYQTEQEWIVSEIADRIARTAERAGNERLRGAAITVSTRQAADVDLLTTASLTVSIEGAEPVGVTITVPDHIWAPEPYAVLAASLLRPGGGTPAGDDGQAFAAALLEPSLTRLLEEDRRISAALAAAPLDAVLHEQAALLTATLALKENADFFSDVRKLLAWSTAHLVMSRALKGSGGYGPAGRIASVLISTLVGRQDAAVAELRAWKPGERDRAARAWIVAIGLRLAGDWRGVTVDGRSSLLERLEYARTLRSHIGPSRFLEFFDEIDAEPLADWSRVALHDDWEPFTIETGHRFVDLGHALELAEIEQAWRRFHQGAPDHTTLIRALTQPTPASSQVVGWNGWREILQRHLAAQLVAEYTHLANLGLIEETKAWPSEAEAQFGSLELFPFVLQHTAQEAPRLERAITAARALEIRRPDMVTARLSNQLRAKPHVPVTIPRLPQDFAWFTPHVPTGTAFELMHRTLKEGCPRPVPLPVVERWTRMAPYDMWSAWSLAWLSVPGVPAFTDVAQAFGTIPQYDLRAGRLMFKHLRATSRQYVEVAERMCQADAEECAALAAELVSDGRDREAVAAYERFARESRDTVHVSNELDWIVRYYWDTGQEARARELAEGAGSTGSSSGLDLLAYVREREGRFDEAEALLTRIVDRYEQKEPLAGFYFRKAQRTGEAAWKQKAAELVGQTFPHGFEPGDAAWLPAPPQDGMVFATFGRRAAATGLRPADVIVAVDGHRIRFVNQYFFLASGSYDRKMRFVVWRDQRYQEIVAEVPQRWFGVRLANHPSTSPPHDKRTQ